MASEGRRAFVAQLAAGAGLAALGGCSGRPSSQASTTTASPAVSGPALPELVSFEAVLRGTVLALRYRYSRAVARRFAGPPWTATLLVAIHPPTGAPACRSLATGALRTEAPVLNQSVFHAAAELDVPGFFGLRAPFVRYVHASFLHLRSDVVRVASG